MSYDKKTMNLENKLADHIPPEFIPIILKGSPELFDLEVGGEIVEAVNFWYQGQECDCYLIEPLFLKQVDTDKVFDNFPNLIAAIAEDTTAISPTPKTMTDWNKNNYETPDKEAQAMANLVLPTEKRILEPCAGTGQIVKALLTLEHRPEIIAHEIDFSRYLQLKELECSKFACGHINFLGVDDLSSDLYYDLIITNPPFDYVIEFIAKSLTVLNNKPESRLLFLMPMDTLCSQGRSAQFKALDCHVSTINVIPGRTDYLKDGVPMSKCQKIKDGIPQFNKDGKPIMNSGRQVSDAVFEIKKGKGNFFTFLEV